MDINQALKTSFLRQHPVDAARALEAMRSEELSKELAGIEASLLTPVLEVMAMRSAVLLFANLDYENQLAVISSSSSRLAMILLEGLPEKERNELVAALPPAIAEDLDRLMQFAPNTAGRLMDRPFDTVRTTATVADVLDRLRASDLRQARSIYIVDDYNRLAGRVDMQALALADTTQPLSQIMMEIDGSVLVTAGREEIVEVLDLLRVDSVPVVDVEGRLMGVVRYQRLFEAIESVVSADMQKMVGASADERAMSPAPFAVKRRLPWLHINLLTAFLAASVVGLFENLIAQFTALAVLLPVVAGQSGNAGSQALAVTMRGLALREIGTRHWRSVLSKEIKVGVIDGFALAVTCGAGVFVWSQSLGLALVIGVAMVLSMIAAGISGALVPIVLTRLGQDPATAASIILTTVTDVAGFFAFLGTGALLSFML